MFREPENRNKKLRALIRFIVEKESGHLTKTKLVKLLYLIERRHYIQTGKLLTGVDWVLYFYGPYAHEISSTLADMDGQDIDERSMVSYDGTSYYIYYAGEEPAIDPVKNLSKTEFKIAKTVLDQYGQVSLKSILDEVYDLPEVKKATPGHSIDFSKIRKSSK